MNLLCMLTTICAQYDKFLIPIQDSLIKDAEENYQRNNDAERTACIYMALNKDSYYDETVLKEFMEYTQETVFGIRCRTIYTSDENDWNLYVQGMFMHIFDNYAADEYGLKDFYDINNTMETHPVLNIKNTYNIEGIFSENRKKGTYSVVSNINEINKIKELAESFIKKFDKTLLQKQYNAHFIFCLVFDSVETKKKYIDEAFFTKKFSNPHAFKVQVDAILNIGSTIAACDYPQPELGIYRTNFENPYLPESFGCHVFTSGFVYRNKFGCFSILKLASDQTLDIGLVDTEIYKPLHSYRITLGPYNNIKTIYINLYEKTNAIENVIKVYIYKANIDWIYNNEERKEIKMSAIPDFIDLEKPPKFVYFYKQTASKHNATKDKAKKTLKESSVRNVRKNIMLEFDRSYALLDQFEHAPNLETSKNNIKYGMLYETDSSRKKKISLFSNYLTNQNIYHKVNLYCLPFINAPELDLFYENTQSKIITRNISIDKYQSAIDTDDQKIKTSYGNIEKKNVNYLFNSSHYKNPTYEFSAITFDDKFIHNCKILQTGCEIDKLSHLSNSLVFYTIKVGCSTINFILRYNFTNNILNVLDQFKKKSYKLADLHGDTLQTYLDSESLSESAKKILSYYKSVNDINMVKTLCLSPKYRRYFYKYIFLINTLEQKEDKSIKASIERKYNIDFLKKMFEFNYILSVTYLKSLISILKHELGNVVIDYTDLNTLNDFYTKLSKTYLKSSEIEQVSYTTHITVCGKDKIPHEEFKKFCDILEGE